MMDVLENLQDLPVSVHAWDVTLTTDSQGGPAFKIDATVDEDAPVDALVAASDEIWEAAMHARQDADVWVYVTFVTGGQKVDG